MANFCLHQAHTCTHTSSFNGYLSKCVSRLKRTNINPKDLYYFSFFFSFVKKEKNICLTVTKRTVRPKHVVLLNFIVAPQTIITKQEKGFLFAYLRSSPTIPTRQRYSHTRDAKTYKFSKRKLKNVYFYPPWFQGTFAYFRLFF